MTDVSRVVMLWPADLKAQIQAEVGKRGLTAYVLEAVREHRKSESVATATPVQNCPKCRSEMDETGCWVCEP